MIKCLMACLRNYEKYFQEVADFKSLIMSNNLKKTFEESSKSRDIFRTQASIYDGVFCEYN